MARKSKKSESNGSVAILDQGPIGEIAEEVFPEVEPEAETIEVIVEGHASTIADAPAPPAEHAEPDPLMAKLTDRQREADELHGQHLEYAELAKQKKKQWEAKVEEVASLIRRSSKPMPLFDKPAPAEPFDPEDDGAATILQIAEGTEGDDDKPWLDTPISGLIAYGMPKKYSAILAEGGVCTVGDISALGEKHKNLRDINGVGEAAENKINDALDALWKARAAATPKAETPCEVTEDEREAAEDIAIDDIPDVEDEDVAESDAMHREAFDDADLTSDDFDPEDESQDDGYTIDEMDPEGGDAE